MTIEKILSVVRTPLPPDYEGQIKLVGTLREFELSHTSPISTHWDRDGDGFAIYYEFKSPGDAIYFGKMVTPLTPVSYSSDVHLLLRRIDPSTT
jgi:hypothetical protein